MKKFLTLLLLVTSMVTLAQQNPTLPVDPNVRTGKLENGLTYYVRHNGQPENRADFYIAQKVGSMQEEDNQAGLAHFLEHMAFNGTENFPGKSMLNYLQDNGIKFGTNINAYTSFDETVYFLTDIPTTNRNLMDSALLVLHDWANAIALEEEELESERGVIREEWRTRGGAQQRLWDQLLPEMFPGSKYAKRMPIGSIDVINNFKPEEIRAYYHKWYRPDLQGIIVVGDFDVDEMEKKIIDLFSPIKLDEEVAEREYYPVPDNKEPIFALATDNEARNTSIMMFYKHDPMPDELKNTQAGYLTQYIKNAAASMMNQRFSEILQKPDAPFTSAYAYDGDFFVATTIRYTYTSLNRPTTLYEYNILTGESIKLKEQEVPSGFNPDDYTVERLWATAPDGVLVPMAIVYKNGLKKDGSNPALIYSYGSYGYSTDVHFSASMYSLIDRGFVYAIAQIRGGSDLGEQWYEDGKLLNKKNTFTDFIACSEKLINDGYTSSDKLAAMGGSAGGLLMGAVSNMRPDLYQTIVAQVPFVDVINTMLDDTLPLTTGEYEEWGNPNEEEYYNYILSYSPYDNISAQDYPNILVTGGINDSQVLFHEPAKYTAKLRALKTDNNILILKMNMESGHGGATGRYEGIKETAFDFAFILNRVGIYK
jgi:predicted Zn-dependent peptidase